MILIKRPALFFKQGIESSLQKTNTSAKKEHHYEIVKYAINRGIKYIICEKPFTTSLRHAQEITELLKKSNSKLTVSYLRRFSDSYSSLIKEININKKIGVPKSIIITCGAGGISTVGTHFLDLCTYLLN